MAHTFIARMKVFPDKVDQFIDTCERMEKAVAEHEPNCLMYKFFRLREENSFAVIESFKTEADDQAHQETEHFKESKMCTCFTRTYGESKVPCLVVHSKYIL